MISKEEKAKEVFERYDCDGSGTITLSEFQKILPDLGINLSLPKSIEYFRMCDENNNGEIDFEEFKAALYVCDSEELNPSGFNPGSLLRPQDAFDMFDKDSSGRLDEDEFHFVMKFLGIDVDEQTHEKMFHKYDRDKSGFLEYSEFKKIWLQLTNPRKELENRNIHIPTLATKAQMVRMLDKILDEEGEKEAIAMKEAKRYRKEQILLKSRKEDLQKVQERSFQELTIALDAAGQVYVFGNGTLGQFRPKGVLETERRIVSPEELRNEKDEKKLLEFLWKRRVQGKGMIDCMKKSSDYEMKEGHDTHAIPSPFAGLNVQDNTVSLWGKNVVGVAISDSSIIAHTARGEVYTWGGNLQWWHEIEAESHKQDHFHQSQLTARSTLIQCQNEEANSARRSYSADQQFAPDEIRTNNAPITLSSSSYGDYYNMVKRVLQYYAIWKPSENKMDPEEYARMCVQNLLTQERLRSSLKIRGKSFHQMTKTTMLKMFHEEIVLECKMLGEVTHLHLRELDAEIAELQGKRKFKLARRRQAEFTDLKRTAKTNASNAGVSAKNVDSEHIPIKFVPSAAVETNVCNSKALVSKEECENNLMKSKPSKFDINTIPSFSSPHAKCWTMISSGAHHVALIDNDGKLYTYGLNAEGRLGLESCIDSNNCKYNDKQEDIHKPKAVFIPGNGIVTNVSCGHSHSAAISDGKMFTWGNIAAGKLGLGCLQNGQSCVPLPTIVPFFKEEIELVSCGSNHTGCVTKNSGTLYMWGCNDGGKLGLGDFEDRYHPSIVDSLSALNIADISCGNSQTLACTATREIKSLVSKSEVTRIEGGILFVAGQRGCLGKSFKSFGQYESFSLLDKFIPPRPIRHVSAGFTHQAAISIDGELFAWGNNQGGCSCQPSALFHFIPKPMHVGCLYNKPKDLGRDKPIHESPPYGNQPFYEIDLQDQCTIHEILLWNKLTDPKNPAIRKGNHTERLFPCWIMVSQKPFPSSAGEGALQKALKFSVASKRLTKNKQCSTWHPPRMVMGRYVRVQLENMDLLEFEKLSVFGNVGIDNSTSRVSSVTCGKQVTSVVIQASNNMEDIKMAHKRALAADTDNGLVLNQLEIYGSLRELEKEENPSHFPEGRTPENSIIAEDHCPLCTDKPCEKCELKNNYRDILISHENDDIARDVYSISELSTILLNVRNLQHDSSSSLSKYDGDSKILI